MKTYDELIKRWDTCRGGQILVDHQHPIKNMYLNINVSGNRELLIPVPRPIYRFQSTEAIGISNYKTSDMYFFAVELLREDLVQEYAYLCFDLIQSSKNCPTQAEAVKVLFETFRKWYSLMADVHRDILLLNEIRGLMGEVKYMIEELSSGKDEKELVDAWTVHKDASRDFIFDTTWSEIKTIQPSTEYISISSVEQLDHDLDGKLIVYQLNQTSEAGHQTYTLNSIINELRAMLSMTVESELNQKLLSKGYTHNEQYEQYVFSFGGKLQYVVNNTFPRISRSMLPKAISTVKYDILLKEIEGWRTDGK